MVRETSTRPGPGEPMEQLVLVSAELDRQLANVSARQANAVTRASIVLAAAGISAFSIVGTSLGWSLVPAFFSILSAFLCLAAIRYWKSDAAQIKRAHVGPHIKGTPYNLLWRQISDKFDELDAARSDLDRKANYIEGAVGMLIFAWVSGVAYRFIVEPIITGNGY